MRILITGGAGYIGSVLTQKLLKEHEVTVYDNLMYHQTSLLSFCHYDNFNFIKADVRDYDKLLPEVRKADVIFPLAALVGAPICDRYPKAAKEINLDAISFIAKNRSKNQLVIYPTTNSGYGNTTGEYYCDENTPLVPISHYGLVKAEAEKVVVISNGITARLATAFGPSPRLRTDLLVNFLVKKALEDKKLDIFEGHFMRNYVHINDIVDCFYFFMQHPELGGNTFNVGNDDINMTKMDLANVIQKIIPIEIIEGEGEDPDKRNYMVSSKKLREAGFSPKRTLEDGIRQLITAYSIFSGSKDEYSSSNN